MLDSKYSTNTPSNQVNLFLSFAGHGSSALLLLLVPGFVHAQATYALYTGIPSSRSEQLIVGVTVEGVSANMGVQVCSGSRSFVKTEFFFKAGEEPDNYQQVSS